MLTTLPAPGTHADFKLARQHASTITTGVKFTVAAAIALGFELNAIRQRLGYSHGRAAGVPKPVVPWKDLVAQETGYKYERCHHFAKAAKAIEDRLTASDDKADRALLKRLRDLPAQWNAADYLAFADQIGAHFPAATFQELLVDLGLAKPANQLPPAADDTPPADDPWADARAAADCIAEPLLGINMTRKNPEAWARHLDALPMDDQPEDLEAGTPYIPGLQTLATIATQTAEAFAAAIQTRSNRPSKIAKRTSRA